MTYSSHRPSKSSKKVSKFKQVISSVFKSDEQLKAAIDRAVRHTRK